MKIISDHMKRFAFEEAMENKTISINSKESLKGQDVMDSSVAGSTLG